jgi:hypothetical protein
MESVYKFSTEEETKLMVLAHAYAGEEKSEDDGNFYPQHPHEGFLVWLRDYNYLVSDLFFENNSDNDSDKSDLTLWWKSTLHAGLFLGEWSSEDREIAIEKVKNMEDTYLRWLQNQKANNKCPPRSQNLLANLLKQISSVEIEY